MLRGVNLSGLEYPQGHQTPVLAAIDYYHVKGATGFRLPIRWELVQPKLGGPLDQTYVAAIHAVIVRAAPATVEIDLHSYGRRDGKVIGTAGAATFDDVFDVWRRLAGEFPTSGSV